MKTIEKKTHDYVISDVTENDQTGFITVNAIHTPIGRDENGKIIYSTEIIRPMEQAQKQL